MRFTSTSALVSRAFWFCMTFFVVAPPLTAADWPGFRGRNATGVAESADKLPDDIGPEVECHLEDGFAARPFVARDRRRPDLPDRGPRRAVVHHGACACDRPDAVGGRGAARRAGTNSPHRQPCSAEPGSRRRAQSSASLAPADSSVTRPVAICSGSGRWGRSTTTSAPAARRSSSTTTGTLSGPRHRFVPDRDR